MFAPVACSRCSQSFQVPKTALGQKAECPWCKAHVTALPVAVIPDGSPPTPELLSLDDAPTLPVRPRRTWAQRLRRAFALAAVIAGVFVLTFGAVRYRSGWVPPYGWAEFAAPDGSCQVEMPAAVSNEAVYEPIPDFPMTKPGQRFIARTWYSGVTTSLGWIEIEPERAKLLRLEDLAGGEIARRRAQLGATTVTSSTVKRNGREGMEVRYRTADGLAVDRILFLAELPRPRLYVLSFAARTIPTESAALDHVFNTFRIRDQ